MASLDEIMAGMSAFKNGINEYAQNNAIKDATSQINQLNSTTADENQRRQQAMLIGHQLSSQLSATGMAPDRAQMTANNLAPKPYGSPSEMMLAGAQQGNMDLMKAGQMAATQEAEFQPTNIVERQKAASNERIAAAKNKNDLLIANIKANAKDGVKELPLAQQNNLTASADAITKLDNIITSVTADPSLVGPGANLNPIRSLDTNKNNLDIDLNSFAQVAKNLPADKARVSTAAGLDTFMKSLPTNTQTPEAFLQAARNKIDELKTNHLRMLAASAGKHDISAFFDPATGSFLQADETVKTLYKENAAGEGSYKPFIVKKSAPTVPLRSVGGI